MKKTATLCLTVCLTFLLAGSSAQRLNFDQNWWQAISDDEKGAFIWGYLDSPCAPAISASTTEVTKFLDAYLPKHSGVRIPAALQVAARQMKPWKALPGGEVWQDAHGFMDGGWWGDTTHGEQSEQRGYVLGYLACRHQPVDSVYATRLSSSISRYYDVPKHEHMKIAYVLEAILAKNRVKSER